MFYLFYYKVAANINKQENLVSVFKKYGVIAAYIFGSRANGKVHAKSDLDLALRFMKDLSLKKELMLIAELSKIYPYEIDLVNLNKAPLPLQFRVYSARKLIYAQNPKAEILLRAKAICMYHDYKYYLDRFSKSEIKRIIQYGLA